MIKNAALERQHQKIQFNFTKQLTIYYYYYLYYYVYLHTNAILLKIKHNIFFTYYSFIIITFNYFN